ncbi:hypothetical protein [Wenjunlia vitaminophila]|uniref:hypothetical protein n=1 Tax=Wenjunlia vitaminophila TaxID=76728 RepID=UPI00037D28F3|nr:hypothetical protein [Wenjunlia vitaminophila]
MAELTDTELEELIKAIGLKLPRGGSLRKEVAHGTYRGARQHRYRGELLCEPCRKAENAYFAERRASRRSYLTEEEWQARNSGGSTS